MQSMMDYIDEDCSGSISKDEFIHAMTRKIGELTHPAALDAAFALFDQGRGKIAIHDIKRISAASGEKLTEDELSNLVDLDGADEDGDGCIDR